LLSSCNTFPAFCSGDFQTCLGIRTSQKRSTLAILPGLLAASKDLWDRNKDSADEDGGHDREGEDPLERDDLGEELPDTQAGGYYFIIEINVRLSTNCI